jgi:hypothetical protein
MGTYDDTKNLSNPIKTRQLTAICGQFFPVTSV